MTLLQRLRIRLSGFGSDDRGSMPTEGVMAATFLIWWYIASFQIFDAYRQKNVNLKAAYTIADMVTREDFVDAAYIEGLDTVFDYLTYSQRPTAIRVSSVYWDTNDNRYEVDWSYSTSTTKQAHTTSTIQSVKGRLPSMPSGEAVILVETFMTYDPIFRVGINQMAYDTFIFTRPRTAMACVQWKANNVLTGCALS